MASEQAIANEAIAKAVPEVIRVAIQAMAAATAERPQSTVGPKIGRPTMKQSSFNWQVDDKYSEPKNIRLEVNNISTSYNTHHTDQLAIVKNWLGRKGLQFIESLTHVEKEKCNTIEGLFETLTNKFRPEFNEMIKSLQFCKLSRQSEENAGEWMGRLRLAAKECSYKEIDRQLKEQFMHSLNDTDMLSEIIWELTKIQENTEVTSEKVLCWAKRVKTQRTQSTIMKSLTETKEYDKLKIMKTTYKDIPRKPSVHIKMSARQTCRYCESSHPLRQCPAYGKKCTDCGKIGHFRRMCRSKRARVMNRVEQETGQDSTEKSSTDSVNINSIHFNKMSW